jgi:RNA polymerase sporulation-specific sigma factor
MTIGTDKDGNEISLIDVLSSDEDSTVNIVEHKVQLKQISNKINIGLNDKEKTIIQMRYGLLDGNPRIQREIALILGMSKSYLPT